MPDSQIQDRSSRHACGGTIESLAQEETMPPLKCPLSTLAIHVKTRRSFVPHRGKANCLRKGPPLIVCITSGKATSNSQSYRCRARAVIAIAEAGDSARDVWLANRGAHDRNDPHRVRGRKRLEKAVVLRAIHDDPGFSEYQLCPETDGSFDRHTDRSAFQSERKAPGAHTSIAGALRKGRSH